MEGGFRQRSVCNPHEITDCGGSGEIRTHDRVAPTPVFKTGAFNRSATLPIEGGFEASIVIELGFLAFSTRRNV